MSSRPTLSQPSHLSATSKVPSTKLSRYYNRSTLVSGTKKGAQGNEAYHGKCVRSPIENSRSASEKIKLCQPKFSKPTYQYKKPVLSQNTFRHNILKPDKSSKPKISLSQEGITQLTSKFRELSSSILHLTTTKDPLGVRSLEALLTKEIKGSLGDAVNDPKFSQGFIQATRELLDSLVRDFEQGKINPSLIKEQKTQRKPFIRANSNTSLCYRDRYFKELVMNVLQSMSSNELEEEVSKAAGVHVPSAESRERIRVIRDMVRAEAGLEPDTLRHLELQLEELKETYSIKQLEILKATREVEKVISDHILHHLGCCNSRSSTDCVQIPNKAREVFRGRRSVEKRNDSVVETGNVVSESLKENNRSSESLVRHRSYMEDTSSQQAVKLIPNIFLGNPTKFKERLKDLGLDPSEMGYCETNNAGVIENIRPYIEKMVKDEIFKVREKGELFSKRDDSDDVVCLNDSVECSSEMFDSNVMTDDDEDDEINEEDTRVFLEALKEDMKERKEAVGIAVGSLNNITSLERIDEEDDENRFEETKTYIKTSTKYEEQLGNTNINTETHISKPLINLPMTHSTFVSLPVSKNNLGLTTLENGGTEAVSLSKMNDHVVDTSLHRVKSKCWLKDNSMASEIIKEMNLAFERFKIMSDDIFSDMKIFESDSMEDNSKGALQNVFGGNEIEFTVEEFSKILMEISIKIYQLPNYLKENDTDFLDIEKVQVFNILTVLENSLNGTFPTDRDFVIPLEDERQLSQSVKNVSKTFSFLSETLNRTPSRLKSQPVSVLKPPDSLTKTLAVLASTSYFRDCFVYTIAQRRQDGSIVGNGSAYEKGFAMPDLGSDNVVNTNKRNLSSKQLEIVKPFNMDEQRSSGEIFPNVSLENDCVTLDSSMKFRNTFRKNTRIPPDVDQYLSNFEHYLGLTSSTMTVQNVSDMFLYLSSVLNDVPSRVKSEKILGMNPPLSLLRALEILYSSDEMSDMEKKTSFDSLTVQNTSDFFLTLSKTFHDMPSRVRHSTVQDLDPPRSLLRAINLLTSLSHNSVLESRSQEEVEAEITHELSQHSRKEDSQDQFFDAVDSLTSLK